MIIQAQKLYVIYFHGLLGILLYRHIDPRTALFTKYISI